MLSPLFVTGDNKAFDFSRELFTTTEGVKKNVHSGIVQASVTVDDLFARPAS